jgi:hypothetical protein
MEAKVEAIHGFADDDPKQRGQRQVFEVRVLRVRVTALGKSLSWLSRLSLCEVFRSPVEYARPSGMRAAPN